jgi:uncharacterized membrane-anchored protein YhcB (DUF1043 family)
MTSAEYQQLVEFLGRQFSEVNQRFSEVNRRFDRRFDEVDLRFTELRQEMLGHFDEIYRRFERLEQEYHAITQALRRSRRDLPTGAAGARSSSATSQS